MVVQTVQGITMKRIILTFVLSVLSVGANAASIFQYQSACLVNCSLYGLSDLDSISGTITLDDVAITANGLKKLEKTQDRIRYIHSFFKPVLAEVVQQKYDMCLLEENN